VSAVDLAWTAGETTTPVVVQWKETADTLYDHEVTLPAGSTRYRVRGLEPDTSYTFRVFYREQAPWAGESTAITATVTTESTARTASAPVNPRIFAGSIDPTTGGTVVDGTYGLEVTAKEFPGFTVFEVAVEDSAGSDTYTTYNPVPRGTIQNVQGARTTWRGLAPNDGKRRSIRAKAIAPGKDDSDYTPVVDVDPYTATRPKDYPITCPTITLAAVTAMSAGVGSAYIRVSFTAPSATWLAEMRYSVRFKEPGGDYGAATTVRGTATGPDLIPAQYGLVYEVTPSTVTSDGEAITEGTATEITMPGVGAEPTITATAGSSSIEYDIAYDAPTTSIEVWSVQTASDPGAGTQENASSATLVTTLRREDGRTSLSLAVDSTNPWRGTTFIPYAGVQRGDAITLHTERDTSASAPADLGTVTNSSKTSTTVTNKVNLAGSHVAGDQIETYRDGVVSGSLYSITSTNVTNGYALVTSTGLVASTSYSFKYKAVRDGVRSANYTTPLSVTTNSAGALDAPTIAADRDGSDPCGTAIVTVTKGSNNPSGTLYRIESSATGTGGWVVQTSAGVAGANTIACTEDETFFRALALANTGGTQSAYSTTKSIDDYSGPC